MNPSYVKPHSDVAGKRRFYSQPAIAESYDSQRFAGRSGEWVNRRELALVRRLLPPAGRALDLACGTGRLSAALDRPGFRVVGLDVSPEMLRVARGRGPAPMVQGDGFRLPFRDGAFDAAVALRLLFHFADVGMLLGEMARVVRPGGALVCDTYRWTPRSLAALGSGRWGGKVFIHPAERLRDQAAACGLVLDSAEDCFLFSPYVYRLLPLPMVEALGRLEAVTPGRLRARTFWRFRRSPLPLGEG
jgi:SAM-dependent methyltransferase